jgi:hypothetical protein
MVRALYRLTWQRIQLLPDNERLWRAVRQRDQVYATGELKPSFFRDESGLSCDLARFSTPEASRRGHAEQPYPLEAGLVEFKVLDVRAVGSDVEHVPLQISPRNYAHSQFTSIIERPDGEEQLVAAASFRIPQRFRVPS